MLTEGQADIRKVGRRSRSLTISWWKFTVSPADARKVDWCWQKVPRMQKMLTEVPVEPRKVDGSWRRVLRTQAKLTKVGSKTHDCSESWLKVTEGTTIARNVNGSFRGRTNVDVSLRKVLRSLGKLKEGSSAARKVHVGLKRSCGCTKTWWMVPEMHGKLTESHTAT